MGRRRERGRAVDGILLLDKPVGVRSNDALQQVKRLFDARKAGHTGSLDSLASGMLPLCLGEATKLSGFLLNADKRYRAVFRLGTTTTTGDADGDTLATRPVGAASDQRVQEALARFTGEIEQIPPMYSALKHKGQRLYELAYRGVEVERPPRPITIHSLELVSRADQWLEVDVHCSKGTYIRTLAEDVGEALGCGAHVEMLRRVQVGPFDAAGMLTLEAVQALASRGFPALDAALLPMDQALSDWPSVDLPSNSAYYLRMGQPVLVPRAPTRGLVRLYSGDSGFLGVGEVLDDGRVAPRRLLSARSNSILKSGA